MRRVYLCLFGGLVGDDGVCAEHGETACVVGIGPADTEPVPR